MSSAKLFETRLCAFLFHFVEHDSVQATADASFQSERHVFRRILPCWAFSSRKSRFRGLAAPQPGDVRVYPRPGQVAFAAAEILFPKSFKTGQQNLFSNLEKRVNDMVSNWCSLEHIFYKTSFYSSPLKAPFEHADVDIAISIETIVFLKHWNAFK